MNEATTSLTRADTELISDLQRVAKSKDAVTLAAREYSACGTYESSTVVRRFGSWNEALRLAGLSASNEINISDDRLFENLLLLWKHWGRQTRRSELSSPPSEISQGPYNRRFGSWTSALQAFVRFANDAGAESPTVQSEAESNVPVTGRNASLSMRWKVLQRDRFTCRACGASPALTAGVELHVDHVLPWSRGGRTVLENLQALCSVCNLGKSDVA